MMSALVLNGGGAFAPPLEDDLRAAGLRIVGEADCASLVQTAIKFAPDVVVGFEQHPGDALFASLIALQETAARPILLFTTDVDAGAIARAAQCGVSAYIVNGYARDRLRSLVHLACSRFKQERSVLSELADVRRQFAERKLVDRAKGILMGAKRLREEEAFRSLRSAAMAGKQRIGQVSQLVIDSAQYAEAMNRAGQLRMLSQRLVKFYALACHGAAPDRAVAELAASRAQVESNLVVLARNLSQPTFGDLLDAVTAPWARLRTALAAPVKANRLLEVDALADQLLEQAETLTSNLEIAAFAPALRAINVAGRQRMLSQRLAKAAVMAAVLSPADAVARAAIVDETTAELEAGLAYLDRLPMTNALIIGELGHAHRIWADMRDALTAAGSREGRMRIADGSEALLARFDAVTDELERAMQELMGAAK